MTPPKRPANVAKLTDRACKSSSAGSILWDTECRGFGLRTTAAGVKSFILDYRHAGVARRMTIGRFGDWGTEGARKHARALKVQIDMGVDPFATASGQTVGQAWQRFEREELPRLAPTTRADYKRYAGVLVGRLGKKRLDVVTTDQVKQARATYGDKVYAANRFVEFCRTLWNHAIEWGWAAENPARAIDPFDEHPRETYLTIDEARRLVVVLEASPHRDAADLLLFLLATGCRPAEARGAVWEHFEGEIWTKPARTTKQRRLHRVPLNALALKIVTSRPRRGALVFCYPDGRPIRRGEKLWKSSLRKAGITKPATIYVARHTFASIGAAEKLTLQAIGALLGHSNVTTTSRYAHLFDEVLRDGAESVGEAMKSTTAPTG